MTKRSPIIECVDDDLVFKALADPTRRRLLDRLFECEGLTLTELESELEMTRFGVMKHLRVLEAAGLVTLEQMTSALVRAIEQPPPAGSWNVVEVPEIRAAG